MSGLLYFILGAIYGTGFGLCYMRDRLRNAREDRDWWKKEYVRASSQFVRLRGLRELDRGIDAADWWKEEP
jgi:hypothetical protein